MRGVALAHSKKGLPPELFDAVAKTPEEAVHIEWETNRAISDAVNKARAGWSELDG